MRVKFKLFSIYRELAGAKELEVDLPEGSTVLDAVKELVKLRPALRDRLLEGGKLKKGFHLMRGYKWPSPDEVLNEGDVIAIFPPVGGG